MIRTVIGIILVVIHIICCVAVYLAARSHILKVKKILMPVVIFVPLWGLLCVLILNLDVIVRNGRTKEAGVEKMRVNDEIYKSIFVNEAANEKEIVPLEEALIINEPRQRRKLIMDVLNDNPEDYIELLQQARMNEDVEVVHYATTAMAELSKEYDLKLQKLEREYVKTPDDTEVLYAYCDFLGDYIAQGMAQGQMLLMQRNQYDRLLEKKVSLTGKVRDYAELADNRLELKDYSRAAESIEFMETRWPQKEEVWLLKLKYFAMQSRGEKISELISEIDRQHIYLSGKGKEMLAFWREQKGQSIDEEENDPV